MAYQADVEGPTDIVVLDGMVNWNHIMGYNNITLPSNPMFIIPLPLTNPPIRRVRTTLGPFGPLARGALGGSGDPGPGPWAFPGRGEGFSHPPPLQPL